MTTRKHNMTILAAVFSLALFVLGSGTQQADAATFTFDGSVDITPSDKC